MILLSLYEPVAGEELWAASWSAGQTIGGFLSSGFSCLVTERKVCCDPLCAFNLKPCAGEGVSVIHVFIYLYLILLPFNQQIWWFHHLCMLGIFHFSYWIQCNKITYGQRCSSKLLISFQGQSKARRRIR